jgi:hypothetical protein
MFFEQSSVTLASGGVVEQDKRKAGKYLALMEQLIGQARLKMYA